jgi:hypothetical protein
MPLFGLTPVPGALDAPAWGCSTHRGTCYVMAPDTRRARLHAANHFTDPSAARTESGMLPTSPWMLPALVAIGSASVGDDGARRVPDGTIMVPDDPEHPGGAVRVLRRGFGPWPKGAR